MVVGAGGGAVPAGSADSVAGASAVADPWSRAGPVWRAASASAGAGVGPAMGPPDHQVEP